MKHPNIVILYVNNPGISADFYRELLGSAPVEASPSFAMFALDHGMMLGLWACSGVEPATQTQPGSGELAFTVADKQAVEDQHAAWLAKGIRIAQPPTSMDFGYTFVGLDPDGHRLRVFAPSQP